MDTLPKTTLDPGAYRDALIERFDNPALKHRTWQIAMDGSQKLPQRLLGTIRDRLARGLPVTRAALGIAGWMRYVAGTDERGREIDVKDPLAAALQAIADAAGDSPSKLARGLLGLVEIVGNDLPRSDAFVQLVIENLALLFERGALATVRNVSRQAA